MILSKHCPQKASLTEASTRSIFPCCSASALVFPESPSEVANNPPDQSVRHAIPSLMRFQSCSSTAADVQNPVILPDLPVFQPPSAGRLRSGFRSCGTASSPSSPDRFPGLPEMVISCWVRSLVVVYGIICFSVMIFIPSPAAFFLIFAVFFCNF